MVGRSNEDSDNSGFASGHQSALDDIDVAIIRALTKDPQTPNNRLAAIVGSSEMTIARRIKRLVSERLIKVTVQRNMRLLGYEIMAFADLFVEGVPPKEVGDALANFPESYGITYVIGAPQIVAMIMARDNAHLAAIVCDKIATIPGVKRAEVSVALRMLTHRSGIAAL